MSALKNLFLIAFVVLMVGMGIGLAVGLATFISSVTGVPWWISIPVMLVVVWLVGRNMKSPEGRIGRAGERLLTGGLPAGERPANPPPGAPSESDLAAALRRDLDSKLGGPPSR